MQYVAKTQAKPYKVDFFDIPDEFESLGEGRMVVIETQKRKLFMDKEQFQNAIISHEERLGFVEFQLSEENMKRLREERDHIKKRIESYKKALNGVRP